MKSVIEKRLITATLACTLAFGLMGCEHAGKDDGGMVAGWSLLEPTQRYPIVVSQQPSNMSVRVARSAQGLSPKQRADVYDFINKYRAIDAGNSKVVISVPSGSPNEVASMKAVGDMRGLLAYAGFTESTVQVEPYYADGEHQPPIKLSYTRFVAEGPECGKFTTNLAVDYRNLPHENLGCAQQRNLAAMVANPADLVSARTMTPASGERREVMLDRYKKGEQTGTGRSEESASVKGN
jgi:pilus assembly protein CpaD